jgi:hypothetical protein
MTHSIANHGLRGVLLSGALAFCLASTGNSLAGTAFFDDVEDGNHADGNPVTWSRFPAPYDQGDFSVKDGSFVVTPPIDGPLPIPFFSNYWETDVVVESQLYHDVNIHTRVRELASGDDAHQAGIIALDTYFTDGLDGSSVQGILGKLFDGSSGISLITSQNNGFGELSRESTALSHFETDVNLRLVVQGDTVSLKAWPEGDPEPLEPQLSRPLPEHYWNQEGRVGIWAGNQNTSVPVAFRFVNVLPLPVGDFNANGSLDAADLDLLASGMIASDAKFDLDGDADADLADRLKWVNELKRTWMGDADLNGERFPGCARRRATLGWVVKPLRGKTRSTAGRVSVIH